jgi:2-keto-3-deoxy-L-rhamnonate aldolase RhmA
MSVAAEFKARLGAGELLLGTFVKTPHPSVVEVLAQTGLDCLCLDAEHAPFDRVDLDRGILAARAGVLAAYLRSGRSLDLAASRYTQSEAQLVTLREATLHGHTHAWLDRIKPTNPEAYHYWHMALKP